jgi:hypothetical protein
MMSVPESAEVGNYSVRDLGCGIEILIDDSNQAMIAFQKPWGMETETWGRKIFAPLMALGAAMAGLIGWALSKEETSEKHEPGSIGYLAFVTGLALTALYKRYFDSYPSDHLKRIQESRAQLLKMQSGENAERGNPVQGTISNFLTPVERARLFHTAEKVRDVVGKVELSFQGAQTDGVINEEQLEAYRPIEEEYNKLLIERDIVLKPVVDKYKREKRRVQSNRERQISRANEDYRNSPSLRLLEDYKIGYERKIADSKRIEGNPPREANELLPGEGERKTPAVARREAGIQYAKEKENMETKRVELERIRDSSIVKLTAEYTEKMEAIAKERDENTEEINQKYFSREIEIDRKFRGVKESFETNPSSPQLNNFTLHSSIGEANLRAWVIDQMMNLELSQ